MPEERFELGRILSCSPITSDLTAQLEDGTTVSIPFAEITRQTNLSPVYAERQVGRSLYMMPLHDEAGNWSIRAYEEAQYQSIVSHFRDHTRNVYPARFKLIAQGGKLAFYQLAQGVNGAVHVKEFSGGRLDDFTTVELPREIPVAVRDVDDQGHLVLTTKPAFGDFRETVEHLHLAAGSVVSGRVCHHFPQALGVMLSPNVMTLTDVPADVPPGSWVNVEITRVDFETHKIRSRLVDVAPRQEMRYGEWIIGELPAYVDLEEFAGRLNVRRAEHREEEQSPRIVEPPTFTLEAEKSPFSSFPEESLSLPPAHAFSIPPHFQHLDGKLQDVSEAVNTLRFATAWQLHRYLYLTEGLLIDRAKLNAQLDRLCSVGALSALRFQSGGVESKFKTYYPGAAFETLCGHPAWLKEDGQLSETPVSRVKALLASNQLLLGMLNRFRDQATGLEAQPLLKSEKSGTALRPKHRFTVDGQMCLLDSFRQCDLEDFAEKLSRYEQYVKDEAIENAQRYSTLEDGDLSRFTDCAQAARVSFPVFLTTDLKCLPEPVFTPVQPEKKRLFSRLVGFLFPSR